MKIPVQLPSGVLAVLLCAGVVGCTRAASVSSAAEYVRSKGFGPKSMAQVRYEGTLKNTNGHLPEILQALGDSAIIPARAITPTYTLYLESGSSLESETISVQVGEDGFGVIRYLREQAFVHCPKLPAAARAAFNQSTIVLRRGPAK